MSRHVLTIASAVRDVLALATIEDVAPWALRLPGVLNRDLYLAVAKVLALAGGKWNRKAQAHIFSEDPREALGLALASGAIEDRKRAFQAFYTPPELALRLARAAQVEPRHSVLEPSAGHGALLEPLAPHLGPILCVEIDPKACAVLRSKGLVVIDGDFLAMQPEILGTGYDRVLMNPPFENQQDVAHVRHALRFLAPGGRLVAIMSPSWQTRESKAAQAFRTLLEALPHTVEDVPAGAFPDTSVRTVILVVDKPVLVRPRRRRDDRQSAFNFGGI